MTFLQLNRRTVSLQPFAGSCPSCPAGQAVQDKSTCVCDIATAGDLIIIGDSEQLNNFIDINISISCFL